MPGEQIQKELVKINSLLRSKDFSFEMAKELNAAHDGSRYQEFITPSENTAIINKTAREEKIATNLAGFYAMECGVGLLCEQTKLTPAEWLKKIAGKTADSNAVLLLNRFANATWKASQPFRSLNRITRYNFTGAGYLSAEEIEKDHNQITSAASFLLEYMQQVDKSSLSEQMEQLEILVQDTAFAFTIAKFLHSSHYLSQHQQVPLFITEVDDTAIIQKSVREQKIATSIAGFYALECGINYLVTAKGMVPSDILKSIGNNSINEDDKTLLLHFVNATWKAGQPFIGIDRITSETFTPVYFLTKEDIEKDLVQIQTAARKLLYAIEEVEHKK
jgi:hypothetical protein